MTLAKRDDMNGLMAIACIVLVFPLSICIGILVLGLCARRLISAVALQWHLVLLHSAIILGEAIYFLNNRRAWDTYFDNKYNPYLWYPGFFPEGWASTVVHRLWEFPWPPSSDAEFTWRVITAPAIVFVLAGGILWYVAGKLFDPVWTRVTGKRRPTADGTVRR